jgi:hypothetical protein
MPEVETTACSGDVEVVENESVVDCDYHDVMGCELKQDSDVKDSDVKVDCDFEEEVCEGHGDGSGVIQLNEWNTVLGKLRCGMKFDIVVDSGSCMTLISEDVVKSSPYLRNLPQKKTEPRRIRIADGSVMVADRRIDFEVSVQGYVFTLMAQIMPSYGLVKALLGTEDLKTLSAKLDFVTNQLSFKVRCPPSCPFKVVNNTNLKPGTSLYLAGCRRTHVQDS